ncbi:YybH family protein [Parasphingorhabdus sp.]|uniref:YybH family protein n=1 Tax=Parasphingorhabdus sp. TaxID=2709688 RepID=UPI003A8DB9D0
MNYPIVHRCIAAALMLTPLAACGSPSDQTAHEADSAADKTAIANHIKEIAKDVVAAFNAGDAEKAVGFNAPDFIQMFHGQANADNAANLENARSQLADPAAKLAVSDGKVEVSEDGDMAVYTSSYVYDFTDPLSNEPVTELGNWVMIFRRQADGSMKIYREIISDTPPAKAAG